MLLKRLFISKDVQTVSIRKENFQLHTIYDKKQSIVN